MADLKPIIIVSPVFPPSAQAGVPRILAMLRYLTRYGFLPTVVTTSDGELPAECDDRIQVHGLAYKDPRPSGRPFQGVELPLWRRLARDLFALPDRYRHWSQQAAETAWKLARRNKGPVLVSVPPVSLAWSAARLRRPVDAPLIIDFRDAWMADSIRADYYRNPLRRAIEKRMEGFTMNRATVCVAATPSMKRAFETDYPALKGNFHLLLNGYDELDRKRLPPSPELPKQGLNVLYTGSFPGYRSPKYFLQALAELNDPRIRFYVLGDSSGKVDRLVKTRFTSLSRQVILMPRQDYRTCLAWQKAADLLLLIVTAGPGDHDNQMEVTSKPFEYLRAGRPILATVPSGGDVDRILSRFPSVLRTAPDDIALIQRALLQAKKEKTANGPLSQHDRCPEGVEVYSRERQMRQLAEILEKLWEPAGVSVKSYAETGRR